MATILRSTLAKKQIPDYDDLFTQWDFGSIERISLDSASVQKSDDVNKSKGIFSRMTGSIKNVLERESKRFEPDPNEYVSPYIENVSALF